MDKSESALFGEVRSAFQTQLWLTDNEKFRDILEEGYYLLSEDYKSYIQTNLDRVPSRYRRLRYDDVTPDKVAHFLYVDQKIDDFTLAYVRHADLEHIWRNTSAAQYQTLWRSLQTALEELYHIARTRKDNPLFLRTRMSDFHMLLPLEHITLPRELILPQDMTMPCLENRFLMPSLKTLTISDRVIEQAYIQRRSYSPRYSLEYDNYDYTPLPLSSLKMGGSDKMTVRIEVTHPELFFLQIQDKDSRVTSRIIRYLTEYRWEMSYEIVMPTGTIWETDRPRYAQILQRCAATHSDLSISLSQDTWDPNYKD